MLLRSTRGASIFTMLAQATTTQRQVARVVAAVVVTLLLAHVWLANADSVQDLPHLTGFPTLADKDTGTLEFVQRAVRSANLRLTSELKYTKRCLTPSKGVPFDRHDVFAVADPLITQPLDVSLEQQGRVTKDACVPIQVPVAKAFSPKTQYKDLAFGMATEYKRLAESLETISHWASGHGSLLVVVVEDHKKHKEEVSDLQQQFIERDINAVFVPPFASNHTMSQSHFMVLNKMLAEAGPETKWFGLLDDDTFFPHLAPLSAALGSLDHENKDLYVGGLAEEWGEISRFGLMAFGGAGAYLSAHLARKIGSMNLALQCLKESPPELGDVLIRDCVFRHSGARLTVLPDLYQHDMFEDMRGFFESGVEPLNLHHWKSWYHEPVVEMAKATAFCGNCFLQRFTFGSDTVLSNGYSISVYPRGLDTIDLNKMEQTWRTVWPDEDPKFGYTLGEVRDRVADEDHKTYCLKYTEARERTMRQLYVWKGPEGEGMPDEVIELMWTR